MAKYLSYVCKKFSRQRPFKNSPVWRHWSGVTSLEDNPPASSAVTSLEDNPAVSSALRVIQNSSRAIIISFLFSLPPASPSIRYWTNLGQQFKWKKIKTRQTMTTTTTTTTSTLKLGVDLKGGVCECSREWEREKAAGSQDRFRRHRSWVNSSKYTLIKKLQ